MLDNEDEKIIGKPFLVKTEDLVVINQEARKFSWSARFPDEMLDEMVDKANIHLVVPFIKNAIGPEGNVSYRCSLWYKVSNSRRRARVVIDISRGRLQNACRPTVDQIERLVAILIEEVPAEFLPGDQTN
jgi:hypothetical protein